MPTTILRDGTAVGIVGEERGVAFNMQGNKNVELQKKHPKLYVKLNPASAKKWYADREKNWPLECASSECLEIHRSGAKGHAKEGAHVMIGNASSNDVYIIPTCHRCNVNVLEFSYSGVRPWLLVRLTDAERSIIDACNAKPKKRSKLARAKDFVAAKIKVGGVRAGQAVSNAYEKTKSKVTRKKKKSPTPVAEPGGENDAATTTIQPQPRRTQCGSRDTIDGEPCTKGVGCSIDHAKLREKRERKAAK
jgi:hypothetical protein